MSVSVGDILKIVATMVWVDAEVMQNVFAAEITGTGGPYDDSDIVDDAAAWLENMYANMLTQVTNELDGTQVQVYKYDSVDQDFDEVGHDVWSFNPSQVAEYLPKGVAGLINAATTNPDVQGKKYIGGFAETATADGRFEVGPVNALLAFGADWVLGFTGGVSGATWTPGVWSPTDLALYVMDGLISVSTIPAYQRRRKDNVGI